MEIARLQAVITADATQFNRTMAGVDAKGKQVAQGADRMAASVQGAATKIKQSNSIIKESFESVSSEIIESFGIDGDVANMLANEIVKLKASTIIAGAGVAALVVGVGYLTSALAGAASQIRTTAQLTGLTTDQVQKYQTAATAAGVKTDVFTDAITKLRDRAKEAVKGSVEIASSFQALGVNAAEAARGAGPAFERLLDILEKVPDAQTRITIAQRVLGDVSDSTLAGILALTDANGQLRDRVNEVTVAMDKQTVEGLAQINRDWNLFTAQLSNVSKRIGVETLKALEKLRDALAYDSEEAKGFVHISGQVVTQQGQVAGATNSTTAAIQNQASAVSQLTQELATVRISAVGNQVSEEIAKIAVYAKNAKEAVTTFNMALASDEGLKKVVADQKRFKENQEAINKAIDPDKAKKVARAPVDVSELNQLKKQLKEINKDLEGFQKFGSEEFKLRIDLEGARNFKNQLDEIVKMRRELGEPVAVPFPKTAAEADRELAKLKALKGMQELFARQDLNAPIREAAQAQAAAMGKVEESFNEVTRALREQSGDEVANVGAELGERFAEAMANAIKFGRSDIVDAINQITEDAKQKARLERDTKRARETTSVAESTLDRMRATIQNDLNRGIISEIEAKQRLIHAESDMRGVILQALEAEKALAIARGDAAEAARIAADIERTKGLGINVQNRLDDFKQKLGQGFDQAIDALITGSGRWQDAVKNIAVDFFNTLASEMMLAATGGKYSSIGGLLGGLAGGLLSGFFGGFGGGGGKSSLPRIAFPGGGKALGGPVMAGMPYLVGERGPEFFMPNRSGWITPANQTRQMMAGQQITVVNNFHITAPGGRVTPETQQQVAMKAGQGIQAALARNA